MVTSVVLRKKMRLSKMCLSYSRSWSQRAEVDLNAGWPKTELSDVLAPQVTHRGYKHV